jgi:hypothetical protein
LGNRHRHVYRRDSGHYFRWVIPTSLAVRLGCKAGREIRFPLATNITGLALELATQCWLRCRELVNSFNTVITVKDLPTAIAYIKAPLMKAATDATDPRRIPYTPELVPLVDYLGHAQADQLRSTVNYLLAKRFSCLSKHLNSSPTQSSGSRPVSNIQMEVGRFTTL